MAALKVLFIIAVLILTVWFVVEAGDVNIKVPFAFTLIVPVAVAAGVPPVVVTV